jgi:2-hydroxychromene-2-carboxylate isomerase
MSIEFYFDVGSPTAYLAHGRLLQLQSEYDARLIYRPMLLGGVFKAAGSSSPVAVPAKGKYMLEQDLPRFARRYGMPLAVNPFFPINTLNLMRGVFVARALGCEAAYISAVFQAIWVDAKNMGDPAIAQTVLASAELPAGEILQGISDPDIKQALLAATEEAVDRGVFGAPTMFLGDDMFFGQDRLDWVEERLRV